MIGLLMMASGQFLTGNTLYQYCKSSDARSDCVGYVSGVVDTLMSFQSKAPKSVICIPDNFTRGQAADVVEKYLRQNPETRQKPAAELVTLAFNAAYQCSPKGG